MPELGQYRSRGCLEIGHNERGGGPGGRGPASLFRFPDGCRRPCVLLTRWSILLRPRILNRRRGAGASVGFQIGGR